jgi:hypothetical protein
MSKFVDEIIQDLKNNPKTFFDCRGVGVKKENIAVIGYGNTRVLSIIDVLVNGESIPTSYMDKWRLEVAIKNWYRNADLSTLSKTK